MAVQRVRRVVRKIDPWTVLKVSLVFNAVMALVTVLGTVVFWSVFVNAGIPERINELAVTIGIEDGITLDGPVYFRVVVLTAVVGTILMTGVFTLAAVVYNLISDLVGGVELVVLEETGSPRRSRRPAKPAIELGPPERSDQARSLPKAPSPAPGGQKPGGSEVNLAAASSGGRDPGPPATP